MEPRQKPLNDSPFCSMVLLMGTTGSGKSYFINKLKENATVVGNDLYSCTATCQVILTCIGRTKIAVIDCPGFNDTRRPDSEILKEIAEVLSTQYLLEKRLLLRGILWLRDITKVRMEGSDIRTLNLFASLVGERAFPHVVFVSTMWDRMNAELKPMAYDREMQLKDDFWREMILGGSYTQRFLGTKASAEGILSQLIGGTDNVVLQLQQELVDEDLPLCATAAGVKVVEEVEEALADRERFLERCRARLVGASNNTTQKRLELDVAKASKETNLAQEQKEVLNQKIGSNMKGKLLKSDSIRTACAVLSLSVSIVGAALPAAGVCTVM